MKKAFDVDVAWTMVATMKVWAETDVLASDAVQEFSDARGVSHFDSSYLEDSFQIDDVNEDPENPPECSDIEHLHNWLATGIIHPVEDMIGNAPVQGCTWDVGVETLDPWKVAQELKLHGEHPDEIIVWEVYKGTPRRLHHWVSAADYPLG